MCTKIHSFYKHSALFFLLYYCTYYIKAVLLQVKQNRDSYVASKKRNKI